MTFHPPYISIKNLSFLPLCLALSACGGGGGGGDSAGNPVDQPPVASSGLTISGLIGESVSGTGTVTVEVGGNSYPASLDGERFSATIPDSSGENVVTVIASFSGTDIGKPVVLKSYVGVVSQLEDVANGEAVSESELASLYVSAASTSAAAIIERNAGREPTSADALIDAMQVLPQEVILDGAVVLKSVLAGDVWNTFTQENTYGLLQAYPAAIGIADTLRSDYPTEFNQYRESVLNDGNQSLPTTGYADAEILFIRGDAVSNRPSGFALQLDGGTSGEGYITRSNFDKALDNKVTFSLSGHETIVDIEGLWPSMEFVDNREACAPDVNGHYQAAPISLSLKKYLDTATFSAYVTRYRYQCDNTTASFEGEYDFVQVNNYSSGDFTALTQNTFAIGTYLGKDPQVYSGYVGWQPVLVKPNTSGGITQRFDFESGYSDAGTISYLDNGRLALNMNRGDYIEYVPLGTDGPALRTLGILKRADGSVVSVGGDYLVPTTPMLTIPTPSKLVYSDTKFGTADPSSAHFTGGFGFEFLADNTGHQLYWSDGAYKPASAKFSWSQEPEGYLDLRYYYNRVENSLQAGCAESETDCVEWRFREIEPLNQLDGVYFIRLYQEIDYSAVYGEEPGTDMFISSYIERFSVLP